MAKTEVIYAKSDGEHGAFKCECGASHPNKFFEEDSAFKAVWEYAMKVDKRGAGYYIRTVNCPFNKEEVEQIVAIGVVDGTIGAVLIKEGGD